MHDCRGLSWLLFWRWDETTANRLLSESHTFVVCSKRYAELGKLMVAPARTFISYRKPMRSRRTAIEMVATFAVSVVGFSIFVPQLSSFPGPSFVAILGLLVGIVALVIGCSHFWAFVMAHIYEVRIDDQGVTWNNKSWSWDAVIRIRSTLVRPNGVCYLNVLVKREGWLSHLSILVEIRGDDPIAQIDELRRYLVESGYTIPWR